VGILTALNRGIASLDRIVVCFDEVERVADDKVLTQLLCRHSDGETQPLRVSSLHLIVVVRKFGDIDRSIIVCRQNHIRISLL